MPDPERFVEKFTAQVEEWREWRAAWEEYARQGSGIPGESNFHPYDEFTAKLLRDLDGLFKTQEQVNVMMLATLDDLRKARD
ncbi:MAG: hypothetical protein OXC95_08500 [Dehalococcoidia bacterium]|nr:hypothetical protein [Dehalococcoidia bacterium]